MDRERNSRPPCECVREILLMAGNERDFGEAADKSRKREGESEIRTRPGGRKGERLWSEGDWQAVCLKGIVGA